LVVPIHLQTILMDRVIGIQHLVPEWTACLKPTRNDHGHDRSRSGASMVDKAPFPFFSIFSMYVQRKSETNGRRLLTHLDGSYRSYRSSGYSGTNGASLRQGGSTRGCYPRDCKVPPCGKPWGSQVTSSMEKTGKEKPRSERSDLSDLSHMLHGAGIFTHIWMVFFCVFFRPWEPNPTDPTVGHGPRARPPHRAFGESNIVARKLG